MFHKKVLRPFIMNDYKNTPFRVRVLLRVPNDNNEKRVNAVFQFKRDLSIAISIE